MSVVVAATAMTIPAAPLMSNVAPEHDAFMERLTAQVAKVRSAHGKLVTQMPLYAQTVPTLMRQ